MTNVPEKGYAAQHRLGQPRLLHSLLLHLLPVHLAQFFWASSFSVCEARIRKPGLAPYTRCKQVVL